MATKLYLGNLSPIYTPPTVRGAWDYTTGHITGILVPVKEAGGIASYKSTAEAVTTDDYDVLLCKFVSAPVSAQTLTGTIDIVNAVRESAIAANFATHLHVFVTQGDSDSVRGTLLTDYAEDYTTKEWPATYQAIGLNAAQTLTDVIASAGDRIVIEFGYRAHNTVATSYTGYAAYGTKSDLTGLILTDMVVGDAFTALPANRAPFITFSMDISWQTVGSRFTSVIPELIYAPQSSDAKVRVSHLVPEIIYAPTTPNIRVTQFGLEVVWRAGPNITSLTQNHGHVGETVVIAGTGFHAAQGTGTVTVNGIPVVTYNSWSDTEISIVVPVGATTGPVVVTDNDGDISLGSTWTVDPSITSLVPDNGHHGDTFVINGTSFGAAQGANTVTLSGIACTVISWSDTAIEVRVPNAATTGNVVVTVNGVASNTSAFTVNNITAVLGSASANVGASVDITGSGFHSSQGTGSVTVNGVNATITVWSDTLVTFTVPLTTTGNVVITTNYSDSANLGALTIGGGGTPDGGYIATTVAEPLGAPIYRVIVVGNDILDTPIAHFEGYPVKRAVIIGVADSFEEGIKQHIGTPIVAGYILAMRDDPTDPDPYKGHETIRAYIVGQVPEGTAPDDSVYGRDTFRLFVKGAINGVTFVIQ